MVKLDVWVRTPMAVFVMFSQKKNKKKEVSTGQWLYNGMANDPLQSSLSGFLRCDYYFKNNV